VQLSPDEINTFRRLWKKELGKEISTQTAEREAHRLLTLVQFAMQRMSNVESVDDTKENNNY